MKVKSKTIFREIFGKETKLSREAKILFVFLAGAERLCGKLPTPQEIPTRVASSDEMIELSDEGYILGTPKKYSLNYKKLKLPENFSAKIGIVDEPKVLDLIREFQKQHKAYRKHRGPSGERDMIQLRFLVRNYNGHEVKKLIVPFFCDRRTAALKGEVSIGQFFNFAIKKLQAEHGKPLHLTEELGYVKKKG